VERLRPTDQRRAPAAHERNELVEQWKAAEERLALLAVGDPDLYLRHLDAVGRVAQQLCQHADVEELLAAYAQWRTIVSPVVEGEGGELDALTLAGTAWIVRWRELSDARRGEQVVARISDARRHGESWVTISEIVPQPESALSYPCERTIMRVTDGIAVRAVVEIDVDTYGPLYMAWVLRLDPLTGREVSAAAAEPPKTFADKTAWERGVAALLAELDSSTTFP
jgi:hypothetical protein